MSVSRCIGQLERFERYLKFLELLLLAAIGILRLWLVGGLGLCGYI